MLLTLFMSSCHEEPTYPLLLVDADTLLMRGDYGKTDSLLTIFDNSYTKQEKAVLHYRQLLQIGRRFVEDELTADDFSLTDSLCRYYVDSGSRDKYGKALCFLGNVYYQSGDYPSAMNTWLKAKSIAEDNKYLYLLCWLYRNIGDLYFAQRMLDECIEYYQKYFHVSALNQDTLRMAYSANTMGKVYVILNNADSALYYYDKSIALAKHTRHPENIIPYSKHSIADILIQIEEYDKALSYMSHDTLNYDNWAY